MTDEEKKRVVRTQFDAFNRHDEEGFLEVTATDYKAVDVPSGETMPGKEGAREFFRRWSNAFPDGKTNIHHELVSGDRVIVLFTGEGTQSGPLGPFPASNKRAKLEFASVYKVDERGKITETTTYYDQLSLLAQLGHIPVPAAAGAAR
jgi:steroid delta-isomerase-like uncharacterized protein